jgi:hypothetical protein
MNLPVCDGCLQPASDEHIARRFQRLELATRFRPIHIQLLILAEAPPSRPQDYFYYLPAEFAERGGPARQVRGGLSRVMFDELMGAVGIRAEGKNDESCLAEFQRLGLFLADSLECPVEDVVPGVREGQVHANAFELSHRFGPTIVKRILHSYKPKHIALLSARTRHLIPFLEQAGLRDRLLLYQGLPLHFPHPHNPAAVTQFRAGMADLVERLRPKHLPA